MRGLLPEAATRSPRALGRALEPAPRAARRQIRGPARARGGRARLAADCGRERLGVARPAAARRRRARPRAAAARCWASSTARRIRVELALELGHAVVQDPQIVPRGARRRASSCSRARRAAPARRGRAARRRAAGAPGRRSRRAAALGLGRASSSSRSSCATSAAKLVGLATRALGGQLGARGHAGPRARPARTPSARSLGPDVPDRERHHHPAELEERPAGQRRGASSGRNREAHPPRPGRRAGQRRRLGHGQEPLAAGIGSTTSMAGRRSSGRRRRQRPVTRTVTVLEPPSATHSTASIPSEEGRSVIAAHGTAARGRNCARTSVARTLGGPRSATRDHEAARASGDDGRVSAPRWRLAHVPVADAARRRSHDL